MRIGNNPVLSVIFVILPFILLTGPSALKGTWDAFQGSTFDYPDIFFSGTY